MFDTDDVDETVAGPWESDIERLAASPERADPSWSAAESGEGGAGR